MDSITEQFMLFCSILDFGKGSKALKISEKAGASGGVIFLGKGTVRQEWLNKLGIIDARKEIVITIIKNRLEDTLYKNLTNEFQLDKHHHGIAFSIPLKYCLELTGKKYSSNPEKKGENKMSYEAIFVIVDKGLAEDVLDAAEEAGSTGGTIIHGRGGGSCEKSILFNIEIEPEKEIILILSREEKTEAIVNSIENKLNIKQPGAGIVFTLDVRRTLGLYQDK